MRAQPLAAAAIVAMTAVSLVAQQPPQQPQLPAPPQGVLLEPLGQAGEAVFPAFEGWGPTRDGGQVLLIGYYNRNKGQELDIPIGPDNRIEPGGPDYGQPTRFHLGRQYGVFSIVIPKDFGTKKLTWTLRANGHTSAVSFWTNPPYWIDFYKNHANGNEPPRIKFAMAGPEIMGPPTQRSVLTLSGTVGQPVALKAWAADQPPTMHAEEGGGATPPARRPTRAPDQEPPPAIIGGRVFAGGLSAPAPPGGGAASRSPERRGDFRIIWKKLARYGQLWPSPRPADPERIRVAAAALLATGPTAEQAIRILSRYADRKVEGEVLGAAYHRAGAAAELLRLAERRLLKAPDDPLGLAWRSSAWFQLGRYPELRVMAEARLKERPGQVEALHTLAQLAMGEGHFEEARRWLELAQAAAPSPALLNNLAWLSLLQGTVGASDLERAQAANQETEFSEPAELHTLAALHAERGEARPALELLSRRSELLLLEEPAPADWYVIARILEGYGLLEAALRAYERADRASS